MRRQLLTCLFMGAFSLAKAQQSPVQLPVYPLRVTLETGIPTAYESDPPPPFVLRLHLQNVTKEPLTLTCNSLGAPRLSVKTVATMAEANANLYGDPVGLSKSTSLGQLSPGQGAPYCRSLGEHVVLQPDVDYTYSRSLKAPAAGIHLHHVVWNVSVAGGFAMKSPTAIVDVKAGARPLPTPDQLAYQLALDASGAQWYMRPSGLNPGGRLMFALVDELSRQAFLKELEKRGLDPNLIDLGMAPPTSFPARPAFPHDTRIEVTRTAEGYSFQMMVTNRSSQAVDGHAESCEPLRVTGVADGQVVYQQGNTGCAGVGKLPLPLNFGESNSRIATWSGTNSLGQPVPVGQYRVTMGLGQFVAETLFEVSR